MINRFDIIAVGIENESGVIAGVVGALAGCSVVAPAMGKGGVIEGIDHGAVRRLKRQMVTPRQHAKRCRAVDRGDEEFVSPEIAFLRATEGNAEHIQNGCVEVLAGL